MYLQIIILVILLCICCTFYVGHREGFWFFPPNIEYCANCSYRNRRSCRSCNNCGYCINKKGQGECVSSDLNGPLFLTDCVSWEYGNPLNNPVRVSPTQYYFTGYPRHIREFNRSHNKKMQHIN